MREKTRQEFRDSSLNATDCFARVVVSSGLAVDSWTLCAWRVAAKRRLITQVFHPQYIAIREPLASVASGSCGGGRTLPAALGEKCQKKAHSLTSLFLMY